MKVKERPILFSTPMVRAIIEGRKTQTRRVMKSLGEPVKLTISDEQFLKNLALSPMQCPYGQVGDRLWLKETWQIGRYSYQDVADIFYKADDKFKTVQWNDDLERLTEQGLQDADARWRSARFMFKWASRLTLEITDVRVQRLQEITEEDARQEGVNDPYNYQRPEYYDQPHIEGMSQEESAFAGLWDSINGKKHPWSSNPYVWCISFRRIDK